MTFFSSVTIKVHLTSSTMESAIQGKLTPCSQTPFNPIWLRILSLLFPLEQDLWLVLKFNVYSPAALKVGQALIILWNTEDKHRGEGKKSSSETAPCHALGHNTATALCHAMCLAGAQLNQVPAGANGAGQSDAIVVSLYRVGRWRERIVQWFMGCGERQV